jgi:integrase
MGIEVCKRGHTEPRNRFNQCPVCLRESRAAYKKSHATTPRTRIAPPAVATPTTRHAPAIPRSFLAVAREYLSSQDDAAPATVKKRSFILDQLHALHDVPMPELTTPRIVAALKVIESEKDRRETAHRCAMLVGQVTRFALNHGYVTHNVLPAGQLRGTLKPVKVDSHAAIIEPKRFGALLKFIDLYCKFTGSRAQPGVAWAMRLAPLVFVRPGELRKMEWAEVNFEKSEWVIPAEKMKMRRPHVVPLTKQALAILRSAHKVTGKDRYVFRTRRLDEPLSENGFREALHTILGAMNESKDAHTMHGFRSSASTLLNGELGIDSALIELQLAHVKGDRVAGIYDRSQRLPERRAMMSRWATYLDKLKKG